MILKSKYKKFCNKKYILNLIFMIKNGTKNMEYNLFIIINLTELYIKDFIHT